ncbi:hypothetical protein VTJ04DRAFT_4776 [Mycothermus thermophilus]
MAATSEYQDKSLSLPKE